MKKINLCFGRLALLAAFGIVANGCGQFEDAEVTRLKNLAKIKDDDILNSKVQAPDLSGYAKTSEVVTLASVQEDLKSKGILKEVTVDGKKGYELADGLKIAAKSTELGVTAANAIGLAASKSVGGKSIQTVKNYSAAGKNATTFVDADFVAA